MKQLSEFKNLKEIQAVFPEGTKVSSVLCSPLTKPTSIKTGEVHYDNNVMYIIQNQLDGAGEGGIRGFKYSWRVANKNGFYLGSIKTLTIIQEKKKDIFSLSRKEIEKDFPEGTKVKCTLTGVCMDDFKVNDAEVHYEGGGIYILQNEKEGEECKNKKGYRYSWVVSNYSSDGFSPMSITSIEKISGATKQKMNSRETLLKKIAELEAEKKELKRQMDGFRVTARVCQGEDYYYIDSDGEMDCLSDDRDEFDNYHFFSGNYYKTEEEVDRAIDKQMAFNRVMQYVCENNLALTPDWKDESQAKYQIFYNHNSKALAVDYCKQYQLGLTLPFFKSSADAHRVIADCKKDLEFYFL